ncbi:MAG: FAD-dependent oxidoreductase, partial [Bacteriovorax sp.]|nr:FAD-dependent oxidoreductase [Rhizobacter sp.]
MTLIDIKVPDIGDFKDVAVIELLVKAGDTVKPEQSLISVESDKASMEIPSSHAGVVKEVKLKVGDVVNQGSVILSLEVQAAAAAPSPQPSPASGRGSESPLPAPSPAPAQEGRGEGGASAAIASSYAGGADVECDLVVLGAGPGGYSAAFRAADLGLKVVLVERFATLGGVCLNVGCIPSKALLHVAAVMDEVKHFDAMGVTFAPPVVDLAKLRTHKEKVIGKLTGGLAAMAKMRKVTVVQGTAEFLDPFHLGIAVANGGNQTVKFKQAVIAAGSEAVKLPFLPKDDPRVVTSTGALELRQNPERMLIIGGGIIRLEMGTVYSALGARLDVVEMLDGLMQGADRDLVKVWQKMNAPRFDNIMLKTKTVGAEATKDGILVKFES